MKNLAIMVVTLCMAAVPVAAEQSKVQVGTLVCELTDKTNFILVSSRKFDCTFSPAGGKADESYNAEITNIGADLEVTSTEQMVWLVLAPSTDIPVGALAGRYGGAGASAAAGVGVGARVLVGGSNDAVSLQPLAMAGSTGIGAAAGISGLKLVHNK